MASPPLGADALLAIVSASTGIAGMLLAVCSRIVASRMNASVAGHCTTTDAGDTKIVVCIDLDRDHARPSEPEVLPEYRPEYLDHAYGGSARIACAP